ncbi:MAG: Lon protease 2 [Calditrichaeota bacterium]|nr:Lon protease 2 [Calditrichota bacterium]
MAERPNVIPLFPLEKVLFPQMALPLHIFEERYQTMIGECIERDRPFGVLQGADSDHTLPIGTTARVYRVLQRHEDGRLDIIAIGENRFHVDRFITDTEYLQGEVSYFEDEMLLPANAAQIEEMVRLYKLYIKRLGLEEDHREQLVELMDEVEREQELSYLIGQTIGLDAKAQQELLEKTTPFSRVRLLTSVLLRHEAVHEIARDLFEGREGFDPTLN